MIPATRTIEVATRPEILGAGLIAGSWPAQTLRAFKKARLEGKDYIAVPSDTADPRYIIARRGGRYAVSLHYSGACPACRVVCITKPTAPDTEADQKDAVMDFLKRLNVWLQVATGAPTYVGVDGWSGRSVSAVIIGADTETVRRIIDRRAGDNFRLGFAALVKTASGDQPCPA